VVKCASTDSGRWPAQWCAGYTLHVQGLTDLVDGAAAIRVRLVL